jgi:hypothetical protein
MNTDFRVKVDFFGHHKTKKLRRRLGDAGVLCLLQLWAYVAKTKPDGDISTMDVEDIEISACWDGEDGTFVRAAIEAGFIDEDESGYSLHDWTDHNPWAADAVSRSDSSRFSRMAKTHPELYERLKEQGYKGIGQKEYWSLTHVNEVLDDGSTKNNERSMVVNESLNESERTVNAALSPAPAPAPAPAPSPAPSPVPGQGTGTIAADPPGLMGEEREILGVLRTVAGGYSYDHAKDLAQIRKLAVEFPHVDILGEVKKIEAWAVDKSSTKIKNSRAFLRNWIARARAAPLQLLEQQSQARSVYAAAAEEDPDQILADLFGHGRDSPYAPDVGSLREDPDFLQAEAALEVAKGG